MLSKLDQTTWSRAKAVLRLFGVGTLFGVAAVFLFPNLIELIAQGFSEQFGADPAMDHNLALAIFRQNVMVSLMAWLGGVAFAILPAVIVLFNGFLLSYIMGTILLRNQGIGEAVAVLAVGLLPHGIIEIPAFLWAAVLGFRVGLDWLAADAYGKRLATLWMTLKATFKQFAVVIVLLAMAAIVEVFVSGYLVNKL